MPRKTENDKVASGDLPVGQSIFGQSRIQKGRAIAQSTDATIMQQYLHSGNNVTNLTPVATNQLPAFNQNSGSGSPMFNQNTSRNAKPNKNKQLISADYTTTAQSQHNSQLSGLSKNFNVN